MQPEIDDESGAAVPSDERAPRVSVILRTRNRPDMLRDALRDIGMQTFGDLEIVLVDDGDDPAPTRAAVRAAADPRIAVVDRTAETHGRALAANAGIRAARGEYLMIHDDDDAWKPEFLQRTVAHLDAHSECVAVSARTEVVIHRTDSADRAAGEDRGLLNQDLVAITIPDMLRVNRVTTISLLYRASLHTEVGLIDETLAVLEDWDFYLRVLLRHPIDLLPLPALAEWHHRPRATGDAGNSVYALNGEHEATDAKTRDRYIRDAMERSGVGMAMLVACESRRLEAAVEAEREAHARAHAETRARLDDVSRQLSALQALVTERTSVTSLLRRLRRRDR